MGSTKNNRQKGFEKFWLKTICFVVYAIWLTRRVKAKNAITLGLKLYSYTKLTTRYMSFRGGDKVVARNPKPCSMKITILIKPYV